MPRYFFDFGEGEGDYAPDDVGVVLPDFEAARQEAAIALLAHAREVLANSDGGQISIRIREEDDTVADVLLILEVRRAPRT